MASRFTLLSETNHIPSESELLEIEQLLAPDESKLAHLDLDLKEAEARVTKLKQERKAILTRVQPLRAITSLIRRFPQEILERIFTHSRPADGYSTLSPADCPLILLRVCRRWREIAINTPQLWSSFEVTIPIHLCYVPSSPPNPKHQLRVASFLGEVDRWLERSANHPLCIREPGGPSTSSAANTDHIMSEISTKLVTRSSRWKSVDFEPFPFVLEKMAHLGTTPPPILTNLRLASYIYPVIDHADQIDGQWYFQCSGLLTAPNLKSLHLRNHQGQDYPYNFTQLPVSWSNLTSLSLGTMASYFFRFTFHQDTPLSMWVDILPIFQQCTNLRQCSLMLPSDRGDISTPRGGATVPNLQALHLSGCSEAIDRLLEFIDTPRIRELHYQPLHSKVARPGSPLTPRPPLTLDSSLVSFLQKHGDQVQVLSFNLPPSTPNEIFRTCLVNTSSLKQLKIGSEFRTQTFQPRPPTPDVTLPLNSENDFIFTDFHLHLLTPNLGPGDYLCPQLEILRSNIKARITEGAVLSFLNAKLEQSSGSFSNGRSKFQELSIEAIQLDGPSSGTSDADGDGPWQAIRDAGVRLYFSKTDYCIPTRPSTTSSGLGYGTDFGY
ncbi:hypothetical protein EST38_g2169 [Candolleomyces aberdarensis]|uniref:F-box domain-containing protein n=1 Tax=Candolleomyces aberdarensis TaxID=2316362 RepID=A0A4Q2DVC6_9AGAR|nr:hypothetical protein EST38_g2169 [Candolleomyces aberdarensis]